MESEAEARGRLARCKLPGQQRAVEHESACKETRARLVGKNANIHETDRAGSNNSNAFGREFGRSAFLPDDDGGVRRLAPRDTAEPHLMKVSLKHDLTERAGDLRSRLEEEEVEKEHLRQSGRAALSLADSILQGVEQSLEADKPSGALSARAPRPFALPPIDIRPDTSSR